MKRGGSEGPGGREGLNLHREMEAAVMHYGGGGAGGGSGARSDGGTFPLMRPGGGGQGSLEPPAHSPGQWGPRPGFCPSFPPYSRPWHSWGLTVYIIQP